MSDVNIDDLSGYGLDDALIEETPAPRAKTMTKAETVGRMDSILQIPVVLQVVVGSTTLPVADLLKLGRGAVIPLDSRLGDPVEVMINGREIARGEVVVVEDDHTRFGVSLTEIREPQLAHEHE
jgi:flagellar motor switch protein FliN/FliY